MIKICKKNCPNCNYSFELKEVKKNIICPQCGVELQSKKIKEGCFIYLFLLLVLSIITQPIFDWFFSSGNFPLLYISLFIIFLLALYFIGKICLVEIKAM